MDARKPTWEQVKAKINKNIVVNKEGCWAWTGSLSNSGYSRIWGSSGHRLSYMAYIGPIGKGLDIDHLCRNRACVNPEHLEPVTRSVNLRRGIRKQQQQEAAKNKAHCPDGHELTDQNTYVRPSDGARICRVCRKSKDREYAKKNKDKINARKRAWRKKWREKGVRK